MLSKIVHLALLFILVYETIMQAKLTTHDGSLHLSAQYISTPFVSQTYDSSEATLLHGHVHA